MKNIIYYLTLLIIVTFPIFTQEYIDIIETKDGNIYIGKITEYKEKDYIKITTSNNEEKIINNKNIKIITKEDVTENLIYENPRKIFYNLLNISSNEILIKDGEKNNSIIPIIYYKPYLLSNPSYIFNGVKYNAQFGNLELVNDILVTPNLPKNIELLTKDYIKQTKTFKVVGSIILGTGFIAEIVYLGIGTAIFNKNNKIIDPFYKTFDYFGQVLLPAFIGGIVLLTTGTILGTTAKSYEYKISDIIKEYNKYYYYK